MDLLLGAGVAYLATLPVLLWGGARTGATVWPTLAIAAISLLLSAPHYGATLLRVYEQRTDRRRYALFAYYLTALLAACFVLGTYHIAFGSLLVTLYVSWSPWHVGGQNYGIALMFARRRGVDVTPLAKRLLYASFLLSFLLALLSTHAEHSTAVHAAGATTDVGSYEILRLGIPLAITRVLTPILLAAFSVLRGGRALAARARGIAPRARARGRADPRPGALVRGADRARRTGHGLRAPAPDSRRSGSPRRTARSTSG